MKVLRFRLADVADMKEGDIVLCAGISYGPGEQSFNLQPCIPEFYDTETGEATAVQFMVDGDVAN